MRIKNTLRNSAYAIVSYLTIAVLALVVRRFVLDRLPMEYLGYEGLFGDIFAVLAVADLGIASIINYKLYPAIEDKNNEQISRLMSVYKLLYRIVGFGILIIGLILIPFLKYIIKDAEYNWGYVYVVYLLQLAVSLCTYFLAYKRVMLVTHQREAECTRIEWACNIVSNLVKIAVILIFANYLLYLAVSVVNNILSNYLIARKVDKEFTEIDFNARVTKADIEELGLKKDLGNTLIQKICKAVYGGTDSILISKILGITQVALMSNYSLIASYVSKLLTKLLNPFEAAISNYVYDKSITDHDSMFFMFDRLGFFLACFVSTSFYVLFNPFISLIFGEKYVLSTLFVLAFAINQYIAYDHQFLCFYRNAFGRFELDRWYTFSAAVLNIVMSIWLAHYIGIAGIMFGTVIGHMGFWVGRVKVVYSEYITESVWKYIGRQIINVLIWLAELTLTSWVCSFLGSGIGAFILRVAACAVIPNAINFLLFMRMPSMKMMFEYVNKTKQVVVNARKDH